MRVAVIHNLTQGGAHRRLREQVAGFACQSVEFCLGSATPIGSDARRIDFAPTTPARPHALRPPFRYLDSVLLASAWRRLAEAVARCGADVAFVNPCQFLQAPAALIWLSIPSLYFCDEPRRVDYEFEAKQTRRRRTAIPYAPLYASERWLDRRAVASTTTLATNSRYTAGTIERAYGRQSSVVPLGVLDVFRAPGQLRPSSHLLSVGTLIPDKGHALAIEATARAGNPWPLVIVAPRHDKVEEARLQALAAAGGVALEFKVGVSDDELGDLYRGAYALFYLARQEPFGLASIEAQACGTPVLVAAEGGLPETIVHGVSGWAVPRNAAAAADKLGLLVAAPELRQRMAAAAAAHGASHSWARSARVVEQLLEEVVCGSRS